MHEPALRKSEGRLSLWLVTGHKTRHCLGLNDSMTTQKLLIPLLPPVSYEIVHNALLNNLYDLGELGIRAMDAAGISRRVVPHAPTRKGWTMNGCQKANTQLHEAVQQHPDRWSGSRVVLTAKPVAGAIVPDRCINEPGYSVVLVPALLTNGTYCDANASRPVFAAAERLDLSFYLHPGSPA